jgi:hypothetical protein
MNQFYYSDGKNQLGPFSLDELKTKNITKDTLVWYDGLPEWTEAGKLELLSILLKPVPPPLVKKTTPPPITEKKPETKKKGKKKLILWGVITLGVVGLTFLSIYLYNGYQARQQEKAQNDKQNLINQTKEETRQETVSDMNEKQYNEENQKETNAENQRKSIRNNWSKYITLERSQYMYAEIGGISDLSLSITNNTDYTLDEVWANVSYVKANGSIYKTETVYFSGIAPHYKQTKRAPNSDRGVTVDYLEITYISSKQLQFRYEPGNWANNSSDPYKSTD